MSISITNEDAFSAVRPEILSNFLFVNDWYEVNRGSDEVRIFSKSGISKKLLVWVPLIHDASDYTSMVYKAVKSIAEVENREVIQVIEDLQTVAIGDVIRIKSYDPYDHHNYSIPLREGIILLNKAKQMALAAASSVVNKKPILSRNPPIEARQYVKKLRLGQTERGSFLVKLISPLDVLPRLAGEFENFSERLPFSRRAVIELINGLKIIHDISEELRRKNSFEIAPFIEAVPKGVSANLCEALSSPWAENDQTQGGYEWPLEVSITWSYLIRDKSLSRSTEVKFDPDIFPIIRAAAKELRARNPEIITLRGWVNILERDSRTGPGTIRITGRVDGEMKSVRVKLNPEDYNSAVDAHKKGLIVSVLGTFIVERNVCRLDNPANFHLVADDFAPLFE